MTRWKKDEKEFDVKITNDYSGSRVCRVPKPVLDFLGSPSRIKFIISDKRKVNIMAAKKKQKIKQRNLKEDDM